MKGFITLHRYTDRYYNETDSMLVNVSRINAVYRYKYQTGATWEYRYITVIIVGNAEYSIKEDYYTVVEMIEKAMSDSAEPAEEDEDE
jgi:hypothetical protein